MGFLQIGGDENFVQLDETPSNTLVRTQAILYFFTTQGCAAKRASNLGLWPAEYEFLPVTALE